MKAHILPMKYRVKYKLCLYAGLAPGYLCPMLTKLIHGCPLRSAEDNMAAETSYPDRTTAYQMCKEWNLLHRSIRESTSIEKFKQSLKTHYFRITYNI